MPNYQYDCRFFTGYKPCRYKRQCEGCPSYAPVESRIVVISLEAMGAVLRSTCLLQPIRRRYPGAHITWITMPVSRALLENNPLIDKIITLSPATLPLLNQLEFDVMYSVDKSAEAGALANTLRAKQKFGFGTNTNGVIIPLNEEASYQYEVGLNDELKFYSNEKPETQQLTETMALSWQRDDYVLELTDQEKQKVKQLRAQIQGPSSGVIGFNTGCSKLFPYKKLTIDDAVKFVGSVRQKFPDYSVALLGGPEDTERQAKLKEAFADDEFVVNTPTTEGLRAGVLCVATADVVYSGDSLGMHIAIALKIPTVAWFGLSCAQEIDLFDRGRKIQAKVDCSPCWKKSCEQPIKCYERVDRNESIEAIAECLEEKAENL